MQLNQLGRLGVCDTPPPMWAIQQPSEGHPMAQAKPFCDVTEADLREVYNAMPSIHSAMTFERAVGDDTMRLLMQRQAAAGIAREPAPDAAHRRAIPAPVNGRLYLFEDDVSRFYHAMRDAFVVLVEQGSHPSEANALERAMHHMARYTKPAKAKY